MITESPCIYRITIYKVHEVLQLIKSTRTNISTFLSTKQLSNFCGDFDQFLMLHKIFKSIKTQKETK
jgi:hypothetical protein